MSKVLEESVDNYMPWGVETLNKKSANPFITKTKIEGWQMPG